MDRRWFVLVALLSLVCLVAAPAISYAADVAGTVASVDAAGKSLVVKGADGKETKVTWDDKTEVTHADGKKGTAADVKKDAKVKVTHEGGKASKIALQ